MASDPRERVPILVKTLCRGFLVLAAARRLLIPKAFAILFQFFGPRFGHPEKAVGSNHLTDRSRTRAEIGAPLFSILQPRALCTPQRRCSGWVDTFQRLLVGGIQALVPLCRKLVETTDDIHCRLLFVTRRDRLVVLRRRRCRNKRIYSTKRCRQARPPGNFHNSISPSPTCRRPVPIFTQPTNACLARSRRRV